jgi:hypothetical protein
MLNQHNKISASKADIGLTDEGHILIRVHENKEIEVSDIEEINEIKTRFADNKPYTVIFVAPFFGNISKEARELSASDLVYKNAIAKGIVVKNLSARLISTFFIQISKPPAPTKMFATEEEASAWLNKVRQDHLNREQIK